MIKFLKNSMRLNRVIYVTVFYPIMLSSFLFASSFVVSARAQNVSQSSHNQSQNTQNATDKSVANQSATESSIPLPNWWLTLGDGAIATRGMDGMGGGAGTVEVNYKFRDHQLLTARITGYTDDVGSFASDFACFIVGGGCKAQAGFGQDVGLLYGGIANGHYGYVSASAGLSYFRGQQTRLEFLDANGNVDEQFSDPYHPIKQSIGIPVELQAFFRPIRHFGIGIIATGDINSVASFYGLLGAVQVAF